MFHIFVGIIKDYQDAYIDSEILQVKMKMILSFFIGNSGYSNFFQLEKHQTTIMYSYRLF